jgi:cysteinyl-tRNA synthetase
MANMAFRLYDTLSREVRPLEPIEPGHLRFYSCGPTVYSSAHIGNFRTFLTGDLIVRTAEALGWRVTYASNITDVGHLTDDDLADAGGEDKMERALRSKEGQRFHNVWELAEFYERAFREDWATLNLREPQIRPKATQHMREQILAVETLIRKGHAYETPTGVYFSVESFDDYGKLSGNREQESLRRGVREVVSDENKRHPADFALWKKDEKHLMQWHSPFGWGFPGWHIECSVMAQAYLGDTIDLHGGGEDLIFPHHECEIAQSESLNGKPFANHWVHTRFLQVNGEKMAKSLGNFYTVRDLIERGANPLAIRYALISGVYSKPLNFTDQGLRDAEGNVERFARADALVRDAREAARPGEDDLGPVLEPLYEAALEAMCNDLNSPVALAKAIEGARVLLREGEQMSGASAQSGEAFLARINALLGVVRHEGDRPASTAAPAPPSVDEARIAELVEQRARAKREKDFARADAIREQLDAEGIELRDTPEGTQWVVKGVRL